jgi:hypothetical protein
LLFFTVASSVPLAAASSFPRAFADAAAAEPGAFAPEAEFAGVGARLAEESKDARQARFVAAARPDDCSVGLEWVPDGSVLDDCWAAPQADDQSALVAPLDDYWVARTVDDRSVRAAPPDDCSVGLEWAAADSVPEESVQDDCLVAQWADDHFAPAVLPDDYWVAADLDDSAPSDYSADSLQADYWVAPPVDDRSAPVAARDDSRVQVDLDDY